MEDGNVGETLLKKKYYENCPGCKVDKAKELKTDVSFRNLLNIWMVVLCSSLPISSLFPYLYFMYFYLDKRFQYCKKRGGHKCLCRLCGICIHAWKIFDINIMGDSSRSLR